MNIENIKIFDTAPLGNNYPEEVQLFFGDRPHSVQENTIYAITKDGSIYDFAGFRRPFKIEIEEYNYLKTSELSGDEIRKGCIVKVFCEGIQIFEDFARAYEMAYLKAHNFILAMELNWDWFPKNVQSQIGKIIGYREQLFRITNFIVSEACMILETLDGKSHKPFLWQDEEEGDFDEIEPHIKVSIVDENITWYPKNINNGQKQ